MAAIKISDAVLKRTVEGTIHLRVESYMPASPQKVYCTYHNPDPGLVHVPPCETIPGCDCCGCCQDWSHWITVERDVKWVRGFASSFTGTVPESTAFNVGFFVSDEYGLAPYVPADECMLCEYLDHPNAHVEFSVDLPGGGSEVVGSCDYSNITYDGFNLSASADCSIKVEVPVEVWAETIDPAATSQIFAPYPGASPYGITREARVYYVPTGTVTVTKKVNKTEGTPEVATYEGAALIEFQERLKYGFESEAGPVTSDGTISVTNDILVPIGITELNPYSALQNVGSLAFADNPSYAGIAADLGGGVTGRVVLSGSGATLYVTGGTGSMDVTIYTGALTYSTGGSIRHLNGTPVQGMDVYSPESETSDTTDAAGAWGLSKTYDGYWSVVCSAGTQDSVYVSDLPTGAHGLAKITNLRETDNPCFPVPSLLTLSDTVYGSDFSGHSDERIDIADPFSIAEDGPDVLMFSAAASKEVHDFTATGWSVVGGTGAATITEENGKLKVVVTSGTPTITRDFSGDSITLAGGRLADIAYSSDNDPDPITWEARGRQWSITRTDYRVDLLDAESGDTDTCTDTIAFNSPVSPWGWGMRNPGVMKFVGLRNGKTYYFDKITLQRLTQEEGGLIEVYVWGHGAYVGNVIGDPRTSDQHFGGTYEQGLIVVVDGVVGAEGASVKHTSGGGNYSRTWITLNSSEFLYPPGGANPGDGLVTKSYPNGNGSALAGYLNPGRHTGYSSVTLSASGYFNHVFVPVDYGTRGYSSVKYLKGHARVRVIGATGVTPVTHKKYIRSGGQLLETNNLSTDASGILVTGPLDQPTTEQWTVEGINATGTRVRVSGNAHPLSYYIGSQVWFELYEIGGPSGRFQTVDSIYNDGTYSWLAFAGPIALPTSGIYSTYGGSYVYPENRYVHEFSVPSMTGGALLCSASTGALLYRPSDGALLCGADDMIDALIEARNHAVSFVTIKR
jgi:hypothetical protein